ncbi:UDP-N-acetylmuramate:L-alanyl-gamma-D-glutamyl-meso-diaminopimelate ligase [hydrothermal vent metagenome]|uniref:UDP-N-acetylmuramate:L-alanyl-gamma-D-glutamyl-meso-diaminopimelate ligase n=1 Tax=hydrothermal vent metagenome TaxID=652676 RepID=A0A3B1AQI0_9ZZZZ
MGGLAILARENGVRVTGSDENVYPPMSIQLQEVGIELHAGYDPQLIKDLNPDCVVIGNALSRGNAVVEYILSNNIKYRSGPQWLAENVLQDRWVLAVAGTHGKTTTASMLAWILDYAQLEPGFLIGGIPRNFGISAKTGNSPFFVIEADEYDTAFFDKRSKFVHYKPRTLVLNNLEFDHADIFENLDAIKTQFHHLLRIIPENGLIISNADDNNLNSVIEQGCWTQVEYQNNNNNWTFQLLAQDGSHFEVFFDGVSQGEVLWDLQGQHNIDNAISAIAAARHAGVPSKHALDALNKFENVKRRMELRGVVNDIRVYDDFAHHPTAIATTLNGLRAHVAQNKITVILEARSNTMKSGIHNNKLAKALAAADRVILFQDGNSESKLNDVAKEINNNGATADIFNTVNEIIESSCSNAKAGEHILIMSNGGFENIHERLLHSLTEKLNS